MIRIITALALRLFAIYLLTMLVLSFVVFTLQWQYGIPDLFARKDELHFVLAVLAGFAVATALGLLLWRMSRTALRAAGELDTKAELVPVTVSAFEMQRLMFAGLGTYFCVQAILMLLNGLVVRLDGPFKVVGSPMTKLPLAWLMPPLVELLIGMGLILGATGWRSLLQRVRGR